MYSGESMMHAVWQDLKARQGAVSKPLTPLLKDQSLLKNYRINLARPEAIPHKKGSKAQAISDLTKAGYTPEEIETWLANNTERLGLR